MSYADDWREDRRLWKCFLLWWMGGAVFIAITLFALTYLLGLFLPPRKLEAVVNGFLFVLGGLWALGTIGWSLKLFVGFSCPRCGRSFYIKSFVHNPWTGRCMHCGLRKGTLES
ncbi:hypothetical protein [Cystobacter ferrugineus]|uniref:Uncharacterized protein n=1 Tax=Cystobacter ferrugineus TaxID=83449 RepID=A0A1L9B776_9BACT|nr:hypothetical protein [Cystobacter ferrugineus]OJH38080.1 hypothetical protein BON30_23230 [Cystobacter ferrugineus]